MLTAQKSRELVTDGYHHLLGRYWSDPIGVTVFLAENGQLVHATENERRTLARTLAHRGTKPYCPGCGLCQ